MSTQGRINYALLIIRSGGIGSGIARALAAEGCDVVLHCNSSLVSTTKLNTNFH